MVYIHEGLCEQLRAKIRLIISLLMLSVARFVLLKVQLSPKTSIFVKHH